MATPSIAFTHLSPEERLQLVEDLWDSLALGAPEALPVLDSHRRLLEHRLTAYRRDGDPGRPGREVLDEIDAELDQPRR